MSNSNFSETCTICKESSNNLSANGICIDCDNAFKSESSESITSDKDLITETNSTDKNLFDDWSNKANARLKADTRLSVEELPRSLNSAASIVFWFGVILVILGLTSSLISKSIMPAYITIGFMFSLWISSLLLQSVARIIELLSEIKSK